MSVNAGIFRSGFIALIILAAAIFMTGCHNAGEEQVKTLLGDFYASVKIIEDPLYKNAALNEDAEPDKAKDYFEAHERLRGMMVDQDRKAVVLAAFLTSSPTALRPLSFKSDKEVMEAVCALGPTDEKKGTFAMRKSAEKWLIEDFNGEYAKHRALKGASDEELKEKVPAAEPETGAQPEQ
jgi:hypothetical protein